MAHEKDTHQDPDAESLRKISAENFIYMEGVRKQLLPSDFCRLHIDQFLETEKIKYQIYIRLSDDKFLKVADSGDDLTQERIEQYKAKNIHELFMKKEDFARYAGFNLDLAKTVSTSREVNKEKKLKLLTRTAELIVEQIYLDGVSEINFENARSVTETAISLLSDDQDAFDLLQALDDHTDFLYTHSLGVSLFSGMIAREAGLTSPNTLFRVAVGGLLHDIGKRDIDPRILQKRPDQLSADEKRIYRRHPVLGAEILSQVPIIPSEIMEISLQHNENCDGTGFPLKLKKGRIHLLARMVAVANRFCNLTLADPHSPRLPVDEALRKIRTEEKNRFDPLAVQSLTHVFSPTEAKAEPSVSKAA